MPMILIRWKKKKKKKDKNIKILLREKFLKINPQKTPTI